MMQTLRKARREFNYVKSVYRVLSKVRTLQPDSPVTITDELEAAVDALYAGKSGTALPAEEFRAWAAVNSAVSGLFAPLALAGTVEG